jgi:hypothetical protein
MHCCSGLCQQDRVTLCFSAVVPLVQKMQETNRTESKVQSPKVHCIQKFCGFFLVNAASRFALLTDGKIDELSITSKSTSRLH